MAPLAGEPEVDVDFETHRTSQHANEGRRNVTLLAAFLADAT